MKIQRFETEYGDKGGIRKLTEMRAMMYKLTAIGSHFGVGRDTVSNWTKRFFGDKHDARFDRKAAVMNSMIDFAKNNPYRDFIFAYEGTEYYNEVLQKCKEQKIYDIE